MLLPRSARATLLRGAYGERRGDARDRLVVQGRNLLVEDGVVDPRAHFGVSPYLCLAEAMDVRGGDRVLTLRDGTGIVALHAAGRGARLWIADDAPGGQRCARRNLLLSGAGAPEGCPFPPVEGTWDAVLWVPGFLDSAASVNAPRRDPELERALLRSVPSRLCRGGRLIVALVEDFGGSEFLNEATRAGLRHCLLRSTTSPIWGRIGVHRLWTPRRGESPGPVPDGAPMAGAVWVSADAASGER